MRVYTKYILKVYIKVLEEKKFLFSIYYLY
jgi:hypothetical protein